MPHDTSESGDAFASLGLPPALLEALETLGYESPSPIQAAAIPPLMEGHDVLGQAQTGTGKTAAFALPVLARLDLDERRPQALVLTPTRELAIQVAEAFQSYAAKTRGFRVLPIYGGQSYGPQLAGLRRGVHVIVGTPGRTIDHLKRGTLQLGALRTLVLDEADEMLRMGFIEDVETVLEAVPDDCQKALFSATMPPPIAKIARAHLRQPVEVAIRRKTATAASIHQRFWLVSGLHKLDALTRILEVEAFDAMLVFTRTRKTTEELADKLRARGFAATAIHGDIAQAQREQTVERLRAGRIDILVATDVAARGLDVERISHVVNYDIPHDPESYVHRIGRTGRAGREGQAILFVSPRERGMLRAIERATRQPIEAMQLPSVESVNNRRIAQFKQRITDTLASGELQAFQDLVLDYEREHDIPAIELAAALARLAQGDNPLLLEEPVHKPVRHEPSTRERSTHRPPERAPAPHHTGEGMQTFRIEVGHRNGVKPANIVGAIANEAGLDSQFIGRITIRGDFSLVDLPKDIPKEILRHLQKTRVAGQMLRIHADGERPPPAPRKGTRPATGERKPRKPGAPRPHKPHKPR